MLFAPLPMAARSGGTRRDRLPAEQGVQHAGAGTGHAPSAATRRHRPESASRPHVQRLARRDHDQEERHRTRPLERVRDAPHQQGGRPRRCPPRRPRAGSRPRARDRSPAAPVAGVNDAIPIIPAPSTREPAVAARNRGCRRSSGSRSGSATRRSATTNPARATTAPTPRTTVGTSTPLRPCVRALDRQGHRDDEEHQAGHVDPPGCGRRRLGHRPQAGDRRAAPPAGPSRRSWAASRSRRRAARRGPRPRRCRGRRWRPRSTSRADGPGRAGSGAPARRARTPGPRRRRRPGRPGRRRTGAAPARGRRVTAPAATPTRPAR